MIDITVDNNEVTVEDHKYHSFNDREQLVNLICTLLDKSKFSGESISLHVIRYSSADKKFMKFFVDEW